MIPQKDALTHFDDARVRARRIEVQRPEGIQHSLGARRRQLKHDAGEVDFVRSSQAVNPTAFSRQRVMMRVAIYGLLCECQWSYASLHMTLALRPRQGRGEDRVTFLHARSPAPYDSRSHSGETRGSSGCRGAWITETSNAIKARRNTSFSSQHAVSFSISSSSLCHNSPT